MLIDDLKLLSLKQAEFILKLLRNDGLAFAENKGEGGSVKELYRKGWIEPYGKVGRRVRWRLLKYFNKDQKKLLDSLCEVKPDRITGTRDLGN